MSDLTAAIPTDFGRDGQGARVTVCFSTHALERFNERACPGRAQQSATALLARIVDHGRIVTNPPAWHRGHPGDEPGLFVVLGDFLFPLRFVAGCDVLIAVTCLARGCISPETRARRSEPRAERSRRRSERRVRRSRNYINRYSIAESAAV